MANFKVIEPYDTKDPDYEPSKARPDLSFPPVVFANGMSWEMDGAGAHRIVDMDGKGGEWVGYSFIARSICGNYIAATQCFEGIMPCEMLLRIEVMAEKR